MTGDKLTIGSPSERSSLAASQPAIKSNSVTTMPRGNSKAINIILKPFGIISLLISLTSLVVISIVNYNNHRTLATLNSLESKGVLINAFASESWRLDNDPKSATMTVQNDSSAPGVNASVLHAVVQKGDKYRPYLIRAGKSVMQEVTMGSKLHVTVFGRSKTKSHATIVFEIGHPPFTKDLNETFQLTQKWKQYQFDVIATRNYSSGEAQVRLIIGGAAGEFDFSGMELTTVDTKTPTTN